ncbi:unnamed protein product [Soboliphyme baturini]|uniref:Uncharacterized protein n=1 Tax=Soboliphyme baturini TaxID=241478 RepID=A0A183IUX4_9BILA|nr:unnamed protein product [Soboliphyme baturini]
MIHGWAELEFVRASDDVPLAGGCRPTTSRKPRYSTILFHHPWTTTAGVDDVGRRAPRLFPTVVHVLVSVRSNFAGMSGDGPSDVLHRFLIKAYCKQEDELNVQLISDQPARRCAAAYMSEHVESCCNITRHPVAHRHAVSHPPPRMINDA